MFKRILMSFSIVLMLCFAGVVGWWKLSGARSFFEASFRSDVAAMEGPSQPPLESLERDELLAALRHGHGDQRLKAARELAARREPDAASSLFLQSNHPLVR